MLPVSSPLPPPPAIESADSVAVTVVRAAAAAAPPPLPIDKAVWTDGNWANRSADSDSNRLLSSILPVFVNSIAVSV